MANKIGVDIGGSFIKVRDKRIPTPKNDEKAFVQAICTLIDEAEKPISGIGIGVCGMVQDGVLLYANNLGLENVPIAKILGEKYGVPVRVQNDVACFALAESHHSKLDNLVYIAIGTGVNAGVIANGVLLEGIEYGHTALLDGEVETYISARGLTEYGLPKFLAALDVVLVNICNTYRPKKIFLGGGVSMQIAPHIKRINDNLKRNHYGYKHAPATEVEISTLSTDGGIIGAGLL